MKIHGGAKYANDKKKILIVDDSELNRSLLSEIGRASCRERV